MASQAAAAATASHKGNEAAESASDPAVERLRDALLAAGAGDFSVRLPGRRKGSAGEAERAFNALVERNAKLTAELARMGRVIGRDGRIANAIRSLLRVMATRDGRHVELEIVNEDE